MQIDPHQSVCPACGAAGLEYFSVLHHMICAYVGPEYDFVPAAAGYICPKCRHEIVSGDLACEIVGTSARCRGCGQEMVVSPPAGAAGPVDAAVPLDLHQSTAREHAVRAPRQRGMLRVRLRVGTDAALRAFGRHWSRITGRTRGA